MNTASTVRQTALPQNTHPVAARNALNTHATPIANAALSSPNISAASREKLAEHVNRQQQQALLETAKNAFSPAEEETTPTMITGDIAKTAAKKQSQQALAFMAIDKLTEKAAERPRIQTEA